MIVPISEKGTIEMNFQTSKSKKNKSGQKWQKNGQIKLLHTYKIKVK